MYAPLRERERERGEGVMGRGGGYVCVCLCVCVCEREDDWARVGEVSQFGNKFFLKGTFVIKDLFKTKHFLT